MLSVAPWSSHVRIPGFSTVIGRSNLKLDSVRVIAVAGVFHGSLFFSLSDVFVHSR
jgi:hypothetical protein